MRGGDLIIGKPALIDRELVDTAATNYNGLVRRGISHCCPPSTCGRSPTTRSSTRTLPPSRTWRTPSSPGARHSSGGQPHPVHHALPLVAQAHRQTSGAKAEMISDRLAPSLSVDLSHCGWVQHLAGSPTSFPTP